MPGCAYKSGGYRQLRNLPLFPFIPLFPILMAGSVLGLLIANYVNSRKILDIVEGLENDLAQQATPQEGGQL